MNKHINKYIMIGAALMAFACDKDDLTGDSPLTPSSPTVNIDIANSTVAFVEKDSTFEYTITLSEPQIADVDIYVMQVGGNAVEGEDFTIGTSIVRIPANSTTGTAVISVSADDLSEDTETFTIQIGDDRTANASITPQTVEFTINNATEGELALNFSWDTEFYDASGTVVAPTDVANMRFFITDMDGTVVETVNGTGFESFVVEGDFPDGDYLLKAGIVSHINPGELGDAPVLDLFLEYSQSGVFESTTLQFVGAFDTELVCAGNLFTLASLKKTGTTYTIEEIGEAATPPELEAGNWTGIDGDLDGGDFVGAGDAVIELNGGVYTIDGLNQDFMANFWGETITTSTPVVFTVDEDGMITIEDQFIFTTDFEGNPYDYHVYGTGKINVCGTIIIDYEMDQDGFLVGDWLNTNGYMTDELFKATLTKN
jgi:hypothetical protein